MRRVVADTNEQRVVSSFYYDLYVSAIGLIAMNDDVRDGFVHRQAQVGQGAFSHAQFTACPIDKRPYFLKILEVGVRAECMCVPRIHGPTGIRMK